MGLLGYIFSNVKIDIISDNNNYYLRISNEDYEYQFNCYSGKKNDGKKEVGTSEPVKKLDIEVKNDKNKEAYGATSTITFNNDTVFDIKNDLELSEQLEKDQNDSNSDLKTPIINDEVGYLSDTTLYSTNSEIDDLDSNKPESYSNFYKISRISGPSLLKVNSNGILQVHKDSASTSFSKVEVIATINEISKVTWRTLGCPHENQEISSLSYDNEKSLQLCHHCLQELLPI